MYLKHHIYICRLQPFDAGILKNFQVHYWRLLLQHTLAQLDSNDLTASSIVRTIDILMAIKWIKQAWEDVTPETIAKYFSHYGAFQGE